MSVELRVCELLGVEGFALFCLCNAEQSLIAVLNPPPSFSPPSRVFLSPQAVEIAAAARDEWGMKKECAEALIRHARANRSRDDCSVVVVDLDARALGLHAPSETPPTYLVVAPGGGGARDSVGGMGSPTAVGTTPLAPLAATSQQGGVGSSPQRPWG